ncbi:MAG: hypothetical protein ACREFR_17950 [Limisphaerales bacterium]
MNNLRQIGAAIHLYAANNNDEVVYPNWGTVNFWQGWLFTSQGADSLTSLNEFLTLPAGQKGPLGTSQACPPMNLTAPNVRKYIYNANALSPYVGSAAIYWCPAENAGSKLSSWYQNIFLSSPGSASVSGNDIYSSYIMNAAVIGFQNVLTQNPTDEQRYKLSNVHFKPNYVLMWEPNDVPTPGAVNPFNDGSSRASEADGGQPSQRHLDGCVLLRFDGGTECHSYANVKSQIAGFTIFKIFIFTLKIFNNEFY